MNFEIISCFIIYWFNFESYVFVVTIVIITDENGHLQCKKNFMHFIVIRFLQSNCSMLTWSILNVVLFHQEEKGHMLVMVDPTGLDMMLHSSNWWWRIFDCSLCVSSYDVESFMNLRNGIVSHDDTLTKSAFTMISEIKYICQITVKTSFVFVLFL